MATFKILEAGNPYNSLLDAGSGDAVAVCSTAAGEILITLDDVDLTIVPTARLTPLEAERLASFLMTAALRGRASKADTATGIVACTCDVSSDRQLRILDRECPIHGDVAEAERRRNARR